MEDFKHFYIKKSNPINKQRVVFKKVIQMLMKLIWIKIIIHMCIIQY